MIHKIRVMLWHVKNFLKNLVVSLKVEEEKQKSSTEEVRNQKIKESENQVADRLPRKVKNEERSKRVFNPRCTQTDQQLCLNSSGFITPCCWFDNFKFKNKPWIGDFFKEHLHIDNNEDVDQIFNSSEWVGFFDMLENRPEEAPKLCYKMCGSDLVVEKSLSNKDGVSVRIRN